MKMSEPNEIAYVKGLVSFRYSVSSNAVTVLRPSHPFGSENEAFILRDKEM